MPPNTVTESWTWWKGQPLIKATDERLNSSSRRPYPFQPHEQDFLKFPKLTEVQVTNFLVLNLVNGFQTPHHRVRISNLFSKSSLQSSHQGPRCQERWSSAPPCSTFSATQSHPFPTSPFALGLTGDWACRHLAPSCFSSFQSLHYSPSPPGLKMFIMQKLCNGDYTVYIRYCPWALPSIIKRAAGTQVSCDSGYLQEGTEFKMLPPAWTEAWRPPVTSRFWN